MNYYAGIITDYSFKQIDNMSLIDQKNFKEYCYEHPLVFVQDEHSIIFFFMRIILEKQEYAFLYSLVENATNNKYKGISISKLFKILKCKHTRKRENISEKELEDKMYGILRNIHKKCKKAILLKYQELSENLEDLKKDPENSHLFKNMTPIGIVKNNEEISPSEEFSLYYDDIKIEKESPFYNFSINESLSKLIFTIKDKKIKYSTKFCFR